MKNPWRMTLDEAYTFFEDKMLNLASIEEGLGLDEDMDEADGERLNLYQRILEKISDIVEQLEDNRND